MNKATRLAKALWLESRKRLPFIIACTILVFLVGGAISYRKTAEAARSGKDNTIIIKHQGEVLAQQARDIRTLTAQNKALAEQNNRLAEQHADQLDCITNLFITFINNGGKPQDADAQQCRALVQSGASRNGVSSSGNGASITTGTAAPSESPQSNTQQQPQQSNGGGNSEQPAVDILGLPVCVPFTKLCVR